MLSPKDGHRKSVSRYRIGTALVLLTIFLFSVFYFLPTTHADEVEDLQKQIDDLNKAREQSIAATTPLVGQVESLKAQLAQIQANLTSLNTKIKQKEKDLDAREDRLATQQALLEARVRSYYIRSFLSSPLLVIFSSQPSSEIFRELSYRSAATKQDQKIITSVTADIKDLLVQKQKLEKDKATLASLQVQVDKNADFLAGEINKAQKYQQDLTGKIADLSAKQQEIINARSGNFTVNIGDSELADDINASIKGFRDSAPSGYFAVFSFGAYTHRNGMSQYGALGHVKSQGWNYDQILKQYYPGVSINDVDTNKTILVNGTNSYGQSFNNESFNFEDYLKHIYEVPSSWPAEALKAQAIAARSYAYGKGTICPGQQCQEFKREENSDAWKAAVEATKGKVMSGGPGNWQYSSTTGGWINGMGWDTTDGQGGSNFIDKSFEKIAGSPWVYKAWYTLTYRNDSDKCGRSNPWLSPEEMADLVNATLVLTKGSSDEASRITPVSSCWGGNPYSMGELRDLASKYGGISSANSVTVSQGNGTTNQVTINGISMSGSDFKRAFNLRAPGRLSVPQSGFAFFNIEKK